MPVRSVHGIDIAYDVFGKAGDPTVLVHGSLVDRHSWDAVAPLLAHSLEVVTYDRRGHGESAPVPRPHPVRDDANDLAGLLESLDLYPAHVVAHSYASAVALRLAHDRPEMVRSLAIHEPPYIGLLRRDPATATEGEAMVAGAERIRQLIGRGEKLAAAREVVGIFSTEPGAWERLPPAAQATFVRSVDRWAEEFGDPEAVTPDFDSLPELLLPVLLTVGELSPRFLHRIVRDLAPHLKNGKVVQIPDAGHAPHVTRPHQYAGLLGTFLLERNVPVT